MSTEKLRALLAEAAAEKEREDAIYRRRRSPHKHLLIDTTKRGELGRAAVNALPELLDEIDRLREAVRVLQENWPKSIPAPMDAPR